MTSAFVVFVLTLFQVSPPATAQGCLSYEPATVSLRGTIRRHTFPGPPTYQSVAGGDQPEQVWVLHLSQPICVSAGAEGDAQRNVSDVQLVLAEGQKQ